MRLKIKFNGNGDVKMTDLNLEIVNLPAYAAVGLKWQGTFEQAAQGEIRSVIRKMQERLHEIENRVDPHFILGLSYHDIPGGFTHYSVVKVDDVFHVPEGMTSISVPALTYVSKMHTQDESIEHAYLGIAEWIEANGYKPYTEPGRVYHDPLPIKHEVYELDKILSGKPEFKILIPVQIR
ncbi:GyrI-like domain-containing protein [Caldalkalibacillus thermarum]|nr:GyrI-like domain-containing protein [Caldalkalibacillus thermarum]